VLIRTGAAVATLSASRHRRTYKLNRAGREETWIFSFCPGCVMRVHTNKKQF
jgi:hypothetical protein